MQFAVIGSVFLLIFLGELPDKSMFSTLVLAARGRPLAVWAGAASAFTIHVCVAVAAGGLLSLAPHSVVASIAAALFVAGAVYVLHEGEEENAEEAVALADTPAETPACTPAGMPVGAPTDVLADPPAEPAADVAADAAAVPASAAPSVRRMFGTAFVVIFVAEWGDLTQILTANLAARYQAPLQVGAAALAALWAVAALAALASRFLQRLPMRPVRIASACVMLALAVWSALSAAGVVAA